MKKQDPPKMGMSMKKTVVPKVPFAAKPTPEPKVERKTGSPFNQPAQKMLMKKTTQKISPASIGKAIASGAREGMSESAQSTRQHLMKTTKKKY